MLVPLVDCNESETCYNVFKKIKQLISKLLTRYLAHNYHTATAIIMRETHSNRQHYEGDMREMEQVNPISSRVWEKLVNVPLFTRFQG